MNGLHRVTQFSSLRSIRNTWCIDNSLSTEAGDRAAESYQAGSTKEGQLCRPPAPGQASQEWFASSPLLSPEQLIASAQHMILQWSGLTVSRGRIIPHMACF